ncbi:hypothetical protein D3C85_173180 [compost metagenome]
MKSGDVATLLKGPTKALYEDTSYVICKVEGDCVTLLQDEHGEFHIVNIPLGCFGNETE